MSAPFVTALEPVAPDESKVTPTVAYASVRIGDLTVHYVAVLRRRDGSIAVGMPRRWEAQTGFRPIVTMDDATGQAVVQAVRSAWQEHAA